MSRLIDADLLIERIYKNTQIGHYGEFMDGSEVAYTHNEIVKAIEEQPTAFDTENVFEQLENEKERYEKDRAWWSEHSWKDSCVYNECDMNGRKSDCFQEAIDIVKKGGVE